MGDRKCIISRKVKGKDEEFDIVDYDFRHGEEDMVTPSVRSWFSLLGSADIEEEDSQDEDNQKKGQVALYPKDNPLPWLKTIVV